MQRNTQQREAIRKALSDAKRPLSPQEILASARETVPGMGIATVYRNIRSLLEAGWLKAVELPGTPDRYEEAGTDHHHHFHCRECDRVFEVDDCPGNLNRLAPRGFRVEEHEIILYGLCSDCSGRSEPRPSGAGASV